MEYSDKIIKTFYDECGELVDNLEKQLLLLEKTPENQELINEIFRLVHSIKSEAGLMGFNNFASLAHKLEDVFQFLRDNKLKLNKSLLDLCLKVIDRFRRILNVLNDTGKDEIKNNDLIKKLEKITSKKSKKKELSIKEEKLKIKTENIKLAKKEGYKNLFQVNIKLFDNIALKYARAFLIYNNISSVGKILKTSVDFINQQKDDLYVNFTLLVATNKSENEIYKLADVSEVERVSVKPVYKFKKETKSASDELLKSQSIRVDVEKVDHLMSSVGELIVNYNRFEKIVPYISSNQISKEIVTEFEDIAIQFKRIINSLQDDVMKIRMVPLKTLFDKIPRFIRELSQQLNKEIVLTISGDTEVDKTVIDELREPLIHIIRNAIGHGIETPEERKKKGKNKKGKITINSYQSGNNIIIEIKDDGKGIDIENIKKRAIKMKLISEEEISMMNESEVLNFIFAPGFSTSKKITDVSGRGVGMDVVKKNIERLQGQIKIYSQKDVGTSVIIAIPLTLAVVEALIINTAGINFAIPLYFIEEALRIYKDEIIFVDEYEVINLRESLLPLLNLKEILGLDNFCEISQKKKEKYFVVVVSYNEKKVGIVVDKFISQQDIVIKPISEFINKIEGISGITILGDGSVAYILDPSKLIEHYIAQKENLLKELR